MIVPLVTLALVVTIIGILVAIPWVFAAVVVFLFGYLAFGAFLGRALLRVVGYRRDNLMLAMTVGIIASQLIRLIPFAGAPIVSLMWMIGGGAAIAAFFAWRRSNKQLRAVPSEDAESGERHAPGRLTGRGSGGRGGHTPPRPPPLIWSRPSPGSLRR